MGWSDPTIAVSSPAATAQVPARIRSLAMRMRTTLDGGGPYTTAAAAVANIWFTRPDLFTLPTVTAGSDPRQALVFKRSLYRDDLEGPDRHRPAGSEALIRALTRQGSDDPAIDSWLWRAGWKAADLFMEVEWEYGTKPPVCGLLVGGLPARTFDDSVQVALRIALSPSEQEARTWLTDPPPFEDLLAAVALKLALAPTSGRRSK